jgi:hypothetical protein
MGDRQKEKDIPGLGTAKNLRKTWQGLRVLEEA